MAAKTIRSCGGADARRRAASGEMPSLGANIEHMIGADLDAPAGYMDGTMSGESWKAFLKTVRDEAVSRLNAYQGEGDVQHFQASSLAPYNHERIRIEREYVMALVDLYMSAERAYKTLSG